MASVDTPSKGVRNRGKRRRNKNETMLGDGRRRRKVVAVTVVGSSGENGMEWGYGSSRSRSVATVIWMRFSFLFSRRKYSFVLRTVVPFHLRN